MGFLEHKPQHGLPTLETRGWLFVIGWEPPRGRGNLPGKVTPMSEGHSPDQRRGSCEPLAASTSGSGHLAPAQ